MIPVLFRIGDFEIGTFGLMVAIGFFAGYVLAIRRASRLGYPEDRFSNVLILCLIGGLVGAKLLHIAVYLHKAPISELLFSRKGLVFYGGLIGGVGTGWLLVLRNKWNPAEVADILAPPMALGEVFGRIGCLLNGCCFGKVCHNWMGIRFPRVEYKDELIGSDAFVHHWSQDLVPPDAITSLPVYPTQVFSSLAALATFLFLILFLEPRARFKGQVALVYLLLYSLFRFIIELLRDDPRGFWLSWLSTSQGISLAVAAFAGVMWVVLCRMERR